MAGFEHRLGEGHRAGKPQRQSTRIDRRQALLGLRLIAKHVGEDPPHERDFAGRNSAAFHQVDDVARLAAAQKIDDGQIGLALRLPDLGLGGDDCGADGADPFVLAGVGRFVAGGDARLQVAEVQGQVGDRRRHGGGAKRGDNRGGSQRAGEARPSHDLAPLSRISMRRFSAANGCGKCTPCRVGTKRLLEIHEKICAGKGEPSDLELLDTLCVEIMRNSLCGLGQGAPNPVVSMLKHFRSEYEAHIYEKRCPAKVCRALIRYEVQPPVCTGCTVCARNCPVEAITGERRQVHKIDPDKCIRCGICAQVCNFNAIDVLS